MTPANSASLTDAYPSALRASFGAAKQFSQWRYFDNIFFNGDTSTADQQAPAR
jgi:hypothetical protein